MQGIILYGPPASGKDTITGALHALDSRYVLFPRIKCGPGKASGYRMVSATELSELRAHGEILWENERYGSVYAVDRSGLREHLAAHTPVLHLGQPDAVEAVREEFFAVDWTVADLSCQLDTAKTRLSKRGDVNLEDRLRAWSETERLDDADIWLDTDTMTPQQAAAAIHAPHLVVYYEGIDPLTAYTADGGPVNRDLSNVRSAATGPVRAHVGSISQRPRCVPAQAPMLTSGDLWPCLPPGAQRCPACLAAHPVP